MHLGVIFPQTEIGADPKAVRDFVQAAEGLGYEHVIVFDHVLGVDTAHYQGWQGPYTKHDMFHEPFVLYGYLAAVTQRIELVTAVIILGQRQTALVAKAGGGSRRPERWAPAPGGWHWLERGGV